MTHTKTAKKNKNGRKSCQNSALVEKKGMFSHISSNILGIVFSAGDLGTETQKDLILNFEESFSVTNMYECHE